MTSPGKAAEDCWRSNHNAIDAHTFDEVFWPETHSMYDELWQVAVNATALSIYEELA